VPWLDRYQRMTTRLAEKIARLAQVLPVKQVAAWFGVGWDTVKQIDQRALTLRLGAPEDHLDGLRQLAIDDFAIRRGHQYASVVLDLDRKRVVWIARGRDQEALRGFFTARGPARGAALEAVAVDMWKPYAAELRTHGPQAALVYDRALFIVYVLKDDLKRLWQYRSRAAAVRFWKDWRRRAVRSTAATTISSSAPSRWARVADWSECSSRSTWSGRGSSFRAPSWARIRSTTL